MLPKTKKYSQKIKFLILLATLSLMTVPGISMGNTETGAENHPRNAMFITLGKPLHYNLLVGADCPYLRNFSFSAHYKTKLFGFLSIEPFYMFARSNNFPRFFDDEQKRHDYIMSTNRNIFPLHKWERVYTHSIGLRLHYNFVDNDRWFFSFNVAGGLLTTESSYFEVYASFIYYPPPFRVFSYETSSKMNVRHSGFFYMPGIQLRRYLMNNFFVGVDFYLQYFPWRDDFATRKGMPAMPHNWNFGLILGRSF